MKRLLDLLTFFPASTPQIHYAGRWLPTPSQMRWDCAFAGCYFDLNITRTTSLSLSLANLPSVPSAAHATPSRSQSVLARHQIVAGPISLLARIDEEEYVPLPNASHIVTVAAGSLEKDDWHIIRILAPMTDHEGVIQLDGILLDDGGKLGWLKGTELSDEEPQKLIEVITDMPGSHSAIGLRGSRSTRGLLAGVLGWEYLIGEMFGVDHLIVGVNGMCLTRQCNSGDEVNEDGLGDVYFRSGPPSSQHFKHDYPFTNSVPDIMILNLGTSDARAGASATDFEDTYFSLVKAIRTLAYPGFAWRTTIFIMRPFDGSMANSSLSVMDRLREEGEHNIYWIDTSGWVDTEELPTSSIPIDGLTTGGEGTLRSTVNLSPRANQQVAIYLHLHLCPYLASRPNECQFLRRDNYRGHVHEPAIEHLERWTQDELYKKVKGTLMGEL